jgi:hypothetical protein
MNLIICNESCRHQKDGYCCLEGSSQITNALASPCCYYEGTIINEQGTLNDYDKNS